MTLYADSSALLKRYVDEPDSDDADTYLASDPALVTGRHAIVEVRRNLARILGGSALLQARSSFVEDLASFSVIELDDRTCELAATIAEETGLRTLDALHLGAARRLGTALTFLTFDVRQAQVARSFGFAVVGA